MHTALYFTQYLSHAALKAAFSQFKGQSGRINPSYRLPASWINISIPSPLAKLHMRQNLLTKSIENGVLAAMKIASPSLIVQGSRPSRDRVIAPSNTVKQWWTFGNVSFLLNAEGSCREEDSMLQIANLPPLCFVVMKGLDMTPPSIQRGPVFARR